jgi:phosphoglycolate phosphatase
MRTIKTVIFDFDGVIGDTVNEIKDIVVKLYEELRHEKANPKDVQKFIDKGIKQVIKELKIPLVKLPYFEKRVRADLALKMESLKFFKGMKEILVQIKKEDYALGILSSNSLENLKKIFQKNQVDFFDFIYSGSSFFGKGKVMAKLIKKRKLDPKKTVYIGDEIRDIQAAKQNKVIIIAVGWGYNNGKALKAQKPDYFANKPQDLLKILKKI